jgi:predicted RNase H-like HicB family nuclease
VKRVSVGFAGRYGDGFHKIQETEGRQSMNKKSPRQVAFRAYITEALKNAIYEKGEVLDVIVAEAPDLPGCVTQGASFEDVRENLIDAIEVWVLAGLQCGDKLPMVNECQYKPDFRSLANFGSLQSA